MIVSRRGAVVCHCLNGKSNYVRLIVRQNASKAIFDIAPCLRMPCKINRTRHSLGVLFAKYRPIKCRMIGVYLKQVAYESSIIT